MPQNPNEPGLPNQAMPTPSPVGVTPTFRKTIGTMIEEQLFAIPEDSLEELDRYDRRTRMFFAIAGAGFSCALTLALQAWTTEDSDPLWTWILFTIGLTIGLSTSVFAWQTSRDRNSYLKRTKEKSKPVDTMAMIQAIHAQSNFGIQVTPPQTIAE